MDRRRYFAKKGNKITYYYISGACRDIIITDNKDIYSNVDFLVTGNTGIEAVIETKYKRWPTYKTNYRNGGHIFEYDKYKSMQGFKGKKLIYINIYGDYILMWDVTNLNEDDFYYDGREYPVTTMGESNERAEKKVTYLKAKDCCTIIKRVKGDENYC